MWEEGAFLGGEGKGEERGTQTNHDRVVMELMPLTMIAIVPPTLF